MTTRKTYQSSSRHLLRMAILAASPWFVGAHALAQFPPSTNSPQPSSPRDGVNAFAKPQAPSNSPAPGTQPFFLPPSNSAPAQGQRLQQTNPNASSLQVGNASDARLQVYDVPIEYVGQVGAAIQAQFGADKRVRVTNEPNTGRLMILAPDQTQKQIAQVVEASRRQVGSLQIDNRGNIVPGTIQQNQYKLQRISWRELEDAVGRLAGTRLTISTSNNGELAQLKLVSKDSVQEVMQVDRRNNEVRLQGTPVSVMGWTQVITAIDLGQSDPNRPTQIIPINPATPERIERAVKLIKFASYQQPGQIQEDEVTGTAQVRPRMGDDAPATIVASPDSVGTGSGLIGDVDISFVPEMGLVIIKGSKRDVQRVQEVIEQIKKQSEATKPEIEIVQLKHVNGQALEVILKDLNTKVFSPRQGQIEITALGQPNVLLLIGRLEAMSGIKEVIAKLDTPIDPNSQLRVFKLVNSSAVDAEALITKFFGDAATTPGAPVAAANNANSANSGAGLTVRVKAVSDYRTNSLIVQASPRDQAEVARLIADLDADSGTAESEIKIIPLKFALASELQPILSAAINGTQAATTGTGQQQQPQQQQGGTNAATTAKVPNSRISVSSGNSGLLTGVVVNSSGTINALIVRAPAKSMPLVQELVNQLDIPSKVEVRIKVFEIRNGDATTLATALQQSFGLPTTQTNNLNQQGGLGGLFGFQNQAAVSGGAESSLVPLRIATETRTNSIIVSGSQADLEVIEVLLLRLDEDNAKQRTIEVIWLRNSSATDVSTAITNMITAQRTNLQQIQAPQGLAGQQQGQIYSVIERTDREVYVVPEANTNSILVSAMPRYMPMIRQIVERLDRQQPMIAVDVLIAEVTLDDSFDLGTEFGLQDSLLFDRNSASGGTLSSPGFNQGTALGTNLTATPNRRTQNVAGQGTSGFALGRTNTSLGYGGLVLAAGSESVSMLFRALHDVNRVQILSRPQLMTIDNNIANIQVGSKVPRFAGTTVSTGGTASNVTDADVGLLMQVQPRTNQDGLINMIVAITRSTLGPTASGVVVGTDVNGNPITSPIINTTQAQTRVTAYDGQTVVLSGLITKNRSTRSRRIPWLADIPIAGALFRFDSQVENRTELLVVMTPRVINFNNDEKLEMIKQVESSRMSYCLADILNIHGDVGLSPGNGLWGPAASPIIYPDLQPTVDFENGGGPRRMIIGEPEQMDATPPTEVFEGYPINTPVRSNSPRGAKTLIESATGEPAVNTATPIQNSSYQQGTQQGAYGVAPASYQPSGYQPGSYQPSTQQPAQPVARTAGGR
ncbi:MAG: general secretion pathway protein GspD [Planctomycetota bacterium]|nr:general secretion pathway protein GspD [Planctomycetota bacterium]